MKIIFTNKYTQNEIMTNQILDLFVLVIFPVLILFIVYVMDLTNLSDGLLLKMWNIVKIPWATAVLIWLFALFASRIIKRALYYYSLLAVTILVLGIPQIQITIFLAPSLFGIAGWAGSTIIGISLLLGYYDYFSRTIEITSEYADSIDRENGSWNIRTQIQVDDKSPSAMKKEFRIALLVGFSLQIFSIVIGRENIIFGGIFLFMVILSYSILKRVAKPAAITIKLFGWEQEIGRKIRVISE